MVPCRFSTLTEVLQRKAQNEEESLEGDEHMIPSMDRYYPYQLYR
jgi:hypothetical protein